MSAAQDTMEKNMAAINAMEQEALLRLEQSVVAAYTQWLEKSFSLPVAMTVAGVEVSSAAEALKLGKSPLEVCHCPFRLEDEEKELFCMAQADVRKLSAKFPAGRPELQSPEFLLENYRAVLARTLADSLLAVPQFLPVRTEHHHLAVVDLPSEPFLRFDYDVRLGGEAGRLVRFVSLRLLSTIKAGPADAARVFSVTADSITELSEGVPHVEKAEFAPLTAERPSEAPAAAVDMLYDLHVDVIAELGRTKMQLRDVLAFGRGSIVELPKLAGDPVELFVNDKKIGEGEVVVVDDHFAIRIMHLLTAADRIKNPGE
jgi:flagellar motor switch protein FliN